MGRVGFFTQLFARTSCAPRFCQAAALTSGLFHGVFAGLACAVEPTNAKSKFVAVVREFRHKCNAAGRSDVSIGCREVSITREIGIGAVEVLSAPCCAVEDSC
mmetsp:Transcript_56434/g.129559  ORF Transcript_56434/g.129559 Transcript_56434/m.129559 type:complete len:103 (+) Transcript_56434:425-733(+)